MSILSQLESLLFIASKPLTIKEIIKILKAGEEEVRQTVANLEAIYKNQNRGIRIIFNGHSAEMTTAPENFEILKEFAQYEKNEISQAKIETLTVLAYQGPLTKAELENIRGVNCSLILRNLKIEELVDEFSEDDLVKYQVSTKFLRGIGLAGVEDLPEYDKIHTGQILMTKS